MKTKLNNGTSVELPTMILASDLKRASWALMMPYPDDSFEVWYTERFGWCIPTLRIGGHRRGLATERTYGVAVKDGGVVTMGRGPHVQAVVTVYVRKSRLRALQALLSLRDKGAGDAGAIRDRISTRRARGVLRRSSW
jgi:hypothetical protein